MKKFLFALAAMAAFAFVGCDNESENSDGLAGTVWTSQDNGVSMKVAFNSNSMVTISMGGYSFSGSYIYDYPDVTITLNLYGEKVVMYGKFTDDKLIIYHDDGELFGEFTKKDGQNKDEDIEEELDIKTGIIGSWSDGAHNPSLIINKDKTGKMGVMAVNSDDIYHSDDFVWTLMDIKWSLDGNMLKIIYQDYDPEHQSYFLYEVLSVTKTTMKLKLIESISWNWIGNSDWECEPNDPEAEGMILTLTRE